MKILTKYLLKSLILPLLYCMFGFLLIVIIDDLFDNFSSFLETGIRPLDILYYYSLKLPPVIVEILPACLLLATLYSLSGLTRHSEIIAMRAGGVSIYRIVRPYLGVGVLATLLSGVINETLAPTAAYRAEQFLEYQETSRDENIYFAKNIALKSGHSDWHVQRLDTRDLSLYNLRLVQQRADGSDEIKYEAEKAKWLDGRWWFMDVTVQRYNERGDLFGAPEMILHQEMRELTETPQTFMREIKDPQYLSSQEMIRYLETKTEISEGARARTRVDLHAHMATPFVCLIVMMIGVPVGAHTGRKGAFAGIMLAMTLFFSFYMLNLGAQYLAKLELISAWQGGWLPVAIYGSIGSIMVHRMR